MLRVPWLPLAMLTLAAPAIAQAPASDAARRFDNFKIERRNSGGQPSGPTIPGAGIVSARGTPGRVEAVNEATAKGSGASRHTPFHNKSRLEHEGMANEEIPAPQRKAEGRKGSNEAAAIGALKQKPVASEVGEKRVPSEGSAQRHGQHAKPEAPSVTIKTKSTPP
ncbi:MAG: hypothetical protein OHK0044_06190 [Burkholderiaceae bacterium]